MSPLSGSRGFRSGVVAGVVAALAVMMSPLPATAAPTKPAAPAPSPGSDKHGSGSELGDALQKARQQNKKIEVVGQRTRTSTTFANPDGTLTDELTQAPTRAKAADGLLVPIDTTLAASKGRLAPKATNSVVSIRAIASSTSTGKVTRKTTATDDPPPPSTPDVVNLDLPGAPVKMGAWIGPRVAV